MERAGEVISVVVAAVVFGLVGVLVARRRQHLRLVVRVLDYRDQKVIGFLDHLVQNGQLTPVSPA